MDILQTISSTNWFENFPKELCSSAITAVEEGKVIHFPELAFLLEVHEKKFLSAHYANPKSKNISYEPQKGQVRGVIGTPADQEKIKAMLKRFAWHAKELVTRLLPQYSSAIQQGRTSFRPVEISYRKVSYRKDDSRLHIDAFPATPNQGRRLLRVFSNINPNKEGRIWRVGEPFEDVAKRFLPQIRKPIPGTNFLLKAVGLTKSKRTQYDHIMLKMHNKMKADLQYQKTVPQAEINFASGTSWIVMTDSVSHAGISGQHVLEQTFYLPVEGMLQQQHAPIKILERLLNAQLD